MDLRIRTLGRFAVFLGDRELTQFLDQPIRAALLAYLAVEGEATRDAAEAVVWSDLPPENARHSLNQTLYRLRKDLGESWITSDGDRLRVSGHVRVDTRDFEQARGQGRLDEALALYEGPFLESWHLLGTSAFEHWTDRVRLRLSRMHREVSRARIAELREGGELNRALELSRAWVRKDPLEDEAHHLLIELLARSGHRQEAIERYEALERLLAEEDLTPLEETRELVLRLREGGSLPGADEPSLETGPAAGPASAEPGQQPGRPAPEVPTRRDPPRPNPPRVRARSILLTGVPLVLLGIGLFAFSRWERPGPALESTRVLVIPLENQTGDPSLDPVGRLAAEWIAQGLGTAEFLQVVPSGEIPESFGSSPDAALRGNHLSRAVAAAEERGAGTLVTGAYYASGPGLEFHVRILELPGRGLLEGIGPVRTASLDPVEAVDVLRQRVLVSISLRLDQSLGGLLSASAMPPSYPAYLAYLDGAREMSTGNWAEAARDLLRAHELSPGFVSPLIYGAFAVINAWGDYARADSLARVIEASREALPRYDRLRLDLLHATLRGDHAAAYLAVREAAEITPGGSAHYSSGQKALELNRPREALEILSTWDPTREPARQWTPYWNVLTQAHHLLGNHREELRSARRGRRQIPDQILTLGYEIRALAALGRTGEVRERLEETLRFRWQPDRSPGSLMLMAAQELGAHGHPEDAHWAARRALEWYDGLSAEERSPEAVRVTQARALYLDGQYDAAREAFLALGGESPEDALILRYLGAVAARTGDPGSARHYADSLASLDRPYLFGEHTLGRAVIAALLGEREEAVALVRASLAQGVTFGTTLHSDPDLQVLRDYGPYSELLEPKG